MKFYNPVLAGLLALALLFLSSCSAIQSFGLLPTPTNTPVEPTTPGTLEATPEEQSTIESNSPTETPTPPGPLTLRIWLPPEFNPESGTPAGDLLKARLEEFAARKPDIKIDVRVKDLYGTGGILDTLVTANDAAQLALPDLVILPADILESGASQGILYPFDNLSSSLDDTDWFAFARSIARVKGRTYGLPFAADAMIQAVRPEIITEPSIAWSSLLEGTNPLIFPAADPNAFFTLAMYLANKGSITDQEGKPTLDEEPLVEVLTFYQQANTTGIMPFWLTTYQLDEQAWEGFSEARADQVITWVSRYLANFSPEFDATTIPTPDGTPFTLGKGWVWALTSPNPAHHASSVLLAEFLTESEFLANWTEAMGLLPTRPSALQSWQNGTLAAQLEPAARSLNPLPGEEILSILGPILQKATVDLLKDQSQPIDAARTAVESLK
jgi:multiple sugar transport system substrate-binding protein